MTVDNGVRIVAGCMLLLAVAAAHCLGPPGLRLAERLCRGQPDTECVHRLLPRRHDPEAHGHEIAQTGRCKRGSYGSLVVKPHFVSICCCQSPKVYPSCHIGYHIASLSLAETIGGQLIK